MKLPNRPTLINPTICPHCNKELEPENGSCNCDHDLRNIPYQTLRNVKWCAPHELPGDTCEDLDWDRGLAPTPHRFVKATVSYQDIPWTNQ